MKKLSIILLALFTLITVQAQTIPDPMGDPVQAAVAASGVASGVQVEQKAQSALILKGVITVNDIKSPLNRVLVNDKYYKLYGIIDGEWKVTSITKKKVVLYNLKTKERKNFNFPGV